MSQRWIEGDLYAPKVQKEMQNAVACGWGLLAIAHAFLLLPFTIAWIIDSKRQDVKILAYIIGYLLGVLCLIIIDRTYLQLRRQILKQCNATFFCGEVGSYLQFKTERREIEWRKCVTLSKIEGIIHFGYRPSPVSYIALWSTDGRAPKEKMYLLLTADTFDGVLLPDTPEVRQYLQERLGLKEIPEYPHTVIYSPSQQDPRWVEE